MAVELINGISQAASQISGATQNSPKAIANGEGFGTAIKDAIESIDTTQKAADQQIADAVAGKTPDLHKTIIALQTADLKFQLGLQVRNKLIGAYEEIMRMQV
ncbi:MAG: flagellar hook-basal body complex protein FliE [Pyrinomonadaceae bacterium]|nr:flagellar hook-basal body complex protein FliE [Pyrinomonadaceae bacterium]